MRNAKTSLCFLVSMHVPSDPRVSIFSCLFICYETMSDYNQNCWTDWNSVALCFKRHFHIGVWTFVRFVRPLWATILCVWEIGLVPITAYTSRISLVVKKKTITEQTKKTCHHTDFEADLWPETGEKRTKWKRWWNRVEWLMYICNTRACRCLDLTVEKVGG